jgi:hypothetical protein
MFHFSQACYMPWPSQTPQFDHLIIFGEKSTNLSGPHQNWRAKHGKFLSLECSITFISFLGLDLCMEYKFYIPLRLI